MRKNPASTHCWAVQVLSPVLCALSMKNGALSLGRFIYQIEVSVDQEEGAFEECYWHRGLKGPHG